MTLRQPSTIQDRIAAAAAASVPILVDQTYEFHAEMQEEYLPAGQRMRNYTGTMVTVLSGPLPKDDEGMSEYFKVRTHDGRELVVAEEEINGFGKALGQYFWPDGTYGPDRCSDFLRNER